MIHKNALKIPVLILGGGLAGLSARYHLRKGMSLLVEREKGVGGTARSFFLDGFTFDFTGHLLHLHYPYTKKLITQLLKGKFFRCARNTAIFSKGIYTDYPYQANTFGLPEETVNDCMMGFLKQYFRNQSGHKFPRDINFREWSIRIFGRGISEQFMIPYNEKLYQVSASTLTTDWCGSFVPKVNLEDVIKGALESNEKQFGYNASFLYPKKGGIEVLAKALCKNQHQVRQEVSLLKLDWKNRLAYLSNGEIVKYRRLINTIPLPSFLGKNKIVTPFSSEDQRKSEACGCHVYQHWGQKKKYI
ncbi:hypothetical protein BVX98_03165 [bacterium F11]|nr:hypothetical protein BVX98_03165 [bacterium F11]